MPRITLTDYWLGRDTTYASELTPRIRANAALTVERVNDLLALYAEATSDERPRGVNSGWRPAAVNGALKNAKPHSRHLTAEACDVADADDSLDTWLRGADGLAALEKAQVWIEHPDYTPGWVHIQTVPPGSGRRVFVP